MASPWSPTTTCCGSSQGGLWGECGRGTSSRHVSRPGRERAQSVHHPPERASPSNSPGRVYGSAGMRGDQATGTCRRGPCSQLCHTRTPRTRREPLSHCTRQQTASAKPSGQRSSRRASPQAPSPTPAFHVPERTEHRCPRSRAERPPHAQELPAPCARLGTSGCPAQPT